MKGTLKRDQWPHLDSYIITVIYGKAHINCGSVLLYRFNIYIMMHIEPFVLCLDCGIQRQACPPQWHSDKRNSDQAPQHHPPKPPTRQLSDIGKQETSSDVPFRCNESEIAWWQTASLIWPDSRRLPLFSFPVHVLMLRSRPSRWCRNLRNTFPFLLGKV